MLRRTHTRFWRIWAGNSAFSAVNSNPTASIYHNQEFSGLSTHHRLLSSSSGKFDGKIDPVAALMSQIFKVEIPTVSSIEDSKQKSVSIVPDLSYEFPSLVALKYDGRPVLPFPHYCVINVENLEMIKALNALSSSPTPVVAIFFEKKPEFKGVDSADESLQSEKEESIVDMENTESDSGSIENSGTKLNQGSKVQSAQIQGLSVIHSSEFSTLDQVNSVGVMCRVHSISANMFRLMPLRRVIIKRPLIFNPVPIVSVRHATDPPASSYTKDEQFIMKAQVQTLINLLNRARNDPLTIQFVEDANPTLIADTAAFLSGAKAEELQSYLEVLQVPERLSLATKMLNNLVAIKQQSERIQSEIEKAYTEMNVRHWKMQQYKILKRELGFETDDKEAVKKKLQKMLEKKSLPDDVMKVYEEELEKLSKLESNSSEFNVTRNYLEWLSVLPWGMYSPETLDVRKAKETLDAEHYGLEEIKDRILEFIAVGNLLGGAPSGRILCFLGPPGVGKTSIGKSIAKSLNREFYRFSVGGMHDVAEIKGHRRTYVGAMPGKLIQCLKTVDRQNPVIMIDEIDKIGSGIRGDPSSALLEVLDPEQNSKFLDHYLDVPVDLSKVLFICTANEEDPIPAALADRMEFIRLSGYIVEEKIEIAKKYLIPHIQEACGIKPDQFKIEDSAIESLIKFYCREAGVRSLEKEIHKVIRKSALKIVRDQETHVHITTENLKDFVGKPRFLSDRLYQKSPAGVVCGLAWTGLGGSTFYIETVIDEAVKEKEGSLRTTGRLGETMKESSQIAYTVAKHYLKLIDPSSTFFSNKQIHLHLPSGAIPKDGPSAGIAMVTALISLGTDTPILNDLAMTGEISLTGKVLPIGGVREKTVAAKRSGIKELIFPVDNRRDFEELPDYVQKDIIPHYVSTYDEVFRIAFRDSNLKI